MFESMLSLAPVQGQAQPQHKTRAAQNVCRNKTRGRTRAPNVVEAAKVPEAPKAGPWAKMGRLLLTKLM